MPLLPEVLDECRAADAVLLGAVGGPKWDSTDPEAPRPEQGLLGLRKGLELFANLRPVRVTDALLDASPLRPERVRGADLLIVRELTGGIYFGDRGRRDGVAHDTCVYSVEEIERIADLAFRLAAAPGRRGQVVSVDKANILETSRLWRETVERIAAQHPGVQLEHMLVDNAAMQLIARPCDFDVLLTENMFGDILSDEAAMIAGSIGLLASASLGRGKQTRARWPARPVRARSRLGPRHRGPGQRQPARHLRVGGADAATFPANGGCSRRCRIGHGPGVGAGIEDTRPCFGASGGDHGGNRRHDPGGDRRAWRSRRGRVKGQ